MVARYPSKRLDLAGAQWRTEGLGGPLTYVTPHKTASSIPTGMLLIVCRRKVYGNYCQEVSYSPAEKRFLAELGSRIRQLRTAKDWSQEEFAYRCGLHRTYIGSIERGERNISAINMKYIAEALDASISDLCSDMVTFGESRRR